jgi:Domain of unknown function (DUF4193)
MSDIDDDEQTELAEEELVAQEPDEDVLDLDEEGLEDEALDEEDLDVDLDDAGPDEEVAVAVVEVDAAAGADETPGGVTAESSEDEEEVVLELDEELHPDDVEEPLDVLLQERTAKATLEDDEDEVEEDDGDTDDRGEGPTRIVPRRAGEFLCTSCFLVLPRSQLADERRMLCRDCA